MQQYCIYEFQAGATQAAPGIKISGSSLLGVLKQICQRSTLEIGLLNVE